MKSAIDGVLNEVLVTLFRKINTIERMELINGEFHNISVNDMHIMEVIGKASKSGCRVTYVAKKLSITAASVNIAMNALVKKGYISRQRSLKDKRVVMVFLTERGKRAYRHHEAFHEHMIDGITERISEEEKDLLVKSLTGLTEFFKETEKKARVNK